MSGRGIKQTKATNVGMGAINPQGNPTCNSLFVIIGTRCIVSARQVIVCDAGRTRLIAPLD